MIVLRGALLVLLAAAGICFALHAATGNPKYRRLGLAILKWTLVAAVGFFLVLFIERIRE